MKLTIRRTREEKSYEQEFDIASLKVTTLLSALYEIKAKLDATLTFEAGCRSGVCGACAVRVNGRETLACSATAKDGDRIEPLRYHQVLRDLKVDRGKALQTLESVLPFTAKHASGGASLPAPFNTDAPLPPLLPGEEERFRVQSDCILCDSCYSACPVFEVNADFLGPFALSRAWRYFEDRRLPSEAGESLPADLLGQLQDNGIWNCTLCGECTAVCPQHIDPRADILQLRGESLRAGYSDPNIAAQSFGGPDFGGGFGFDPNGGF